MLPSPGRAVPCFVFFSTLLPSSNTDQCSQEVRSAEPTLFLGRLMSGFCFLMLPKNLASGANHGLRSVVYCELDFLWT